MRERAKSEARTKKVRGGRGEGEKEKEKWGLQTTQCSKICAADGDLSILTGHFGSSVNRSHDML